MRKADNTANNPPALIEVYPVVAEELPAGGLAVNAEVGAVPTTAVAVKSTLAVVIQEGHKEGTLLPAVRAVVSNPLPIALFRDNNTS